LLKLSSLFILKYIFKVYNINLNKKFEFKKSEDWHLIEIDLANCVLTSQKHIHDVGLKLKDLIENHNN